MTKEQIEEYIKKHNLTKKDIDWWILKYPGMIFGGH